MICSAFAEFLNVKEIPQKLKNRQDYFLDNNAFAVADMVASHIRHGPSAIVTYTVIVGV